MNESFLSDMREAVRAMMEADPYYSDVPIISERLKNVEGRIAETVGKASGLAILLVTPIVGKALPNIKGANFEDIQFVARVFENTKSNATGKEALDVAIHTAAFWSQLKPDALSAPLRLEDPPIALGNDPRYLTYDVAAVTSGGASIEIPKLPEIQSEIDDLFVPKETVNDGTRDYSWRPNNGRFVRVGDEPDGSDIWFVDVTPAGPGTNERALFYEIVASSVAGNWNFERIDGVWTLQPYVPGPSGSPAPVLPDGFSFFNLMRSVYLWYDDAPENLSSIFYTLDGSSPNPRNAAAIMRSAQDFSAFNAAPGVALRARAWLPGYIPSAEKKVVL